MSIVAKNRIVNVKNTIEVMTITREIAQQWLMHNTNNRSIKRKHVDRLAYKMKEGRWKLTYDPIRFNNKGALIDGQHRLTAIVEAGIPVQALVVTGIDPDAFDVIDSGKVIRHNDDVLVIDGLEPRVARAVSSAATLIDMYERSGTIEKSGRALDSDVIREFVKSRPSIITAAESINRFGYHGKPLAQGHATMLRYFTAKKDEQLSDVFFEKLYSGANLSPTDMILYLREHIYNDKVNKNKQGHYVRASHVAMCIRVWNALRQGRTIRHRNNVRWNSSEPFPVIK